MDIKTFNINRNTFIQTEVIAEVKIGKLPGDKDRVYLSMKIDEDKSYEVYLTPVEAKELSNILANYGEDPKPRSTTKIIDHNKSMGLDPEGRSLKK